MKDKLGLDLDEIIKIIKASKTNPSKCNDCENNTCKIHKSNGKPSGADKSSRGSKSVNIKMNRGMRISGRAGKPVLDAGLGVSLGNPNVVRQSADTVLQQDTAKLNNELIKYQLELAKKQQADYEQYQTPRQRFKSNKFINDDDEYNTSERFSNYALPRSISLGMLYETSNRLDNLETNFFKAKGNSKFDATDGQFSNTDGMYEDNRVELIDNDSYALPVPNNLSSSLPEDLNLNSPFTSPLPKNDVEEKIKDTKSMLSRFVDKFPRFLPAGGAKVSDFVNNYPTPKSGFAGDNPMIAQDDGQVSVLPNNPEPDANPEPDFGIPSDVKTKKKVTLNPIKDTNTDNDIPTEEKPENLLKQRRRKDGKRQTNFHMNFMLRHIRAYNKTVPMADRYKNLEKLKVEEAEDIFNEIYG